MDKQDKNLHDFEEKRDGSVVHEHDSYRINP